jgi:membrane protease subunit HflK
MLVSLLKKIGLKFSLNDPRWGRGDDNKKAQEGKKPDGPPDLEQLWRDFNQRVNKLFGKRGDGGGGGNNNGGGFRPGLKNFGLVSAAGAAIVFVLWALSGFFIVQEGQTAVIMTFGKYSGHMAPPGFNWRWPYPVQSHEIVNVSQVRTVEVGYRQTVRNKQAKEALMLTDDENIIDIQFAVQYKLKDAVAWVFNNRGQDEMLRQVAETAIREIVGRSKMDFVLYEGREKVALDVSRLMQQILDRYQSGAMITNITMMAVQPPEQVQAAFDDAVKAGQDRERQKNEGQAYANDVVPKARGEAFRRIQEAQAYKARVVEGAVGDAARFKQVLTEYQKAPAVTRDRMYLETMQQIFSNTTKVMADTKAGNNMVYLPLDKMMAQGAAQEAAGKPAASAPAPTATTAPAASDPVDTRIRDNGRSRDSNRDREAR